MFCFSFEMWKAVSISILTVSFPSFRDRLDHGSNLWSGWSHGHMSSDFKDCPTWECLRCWSISGSSAHEKLSRSNPRGWTMVLLTTLVPFYLFHVREKSVTVHLCITGIDLQIQIQQMMSFLVRNLLPV